MNKFEAILLVSPEVSKSVLDDNLKSFEESITKNSGEIKNTEDWGLRDLSYNINNNTFTKSVNPLIFQVNLLVF